MKLRGVAITDQGVQVVISQPFIDGPYPFPREIRKELAKRGFLPVPGFSVGSEADSTYYNDATGIGIFDASSDNHILSLGIPLPIDTIALRVRPIAKNNCR